MSGENFSFDIPDVNSDGGLSLCRGNKKIYIQSLRLFVTNIPATLAKMRILQQSNEKENCLKNYGICVHSIKGMCVYIGAEEARKNAKELEDMAEAGDIKGILNRNETFIKQIEKIISDIQFWFDNNSDFLDKLNTVQNNG